MEIGSHGGGESSESSTAERDAPAVPAGRRVHRFFRDVMVTLVAQACVAFGGLLLARLLARNAGIDGFASYSLVKQAVNVLFPVVTVGLVGGLPRYLALPAESRTPTAGGYLTAAALICGLATLAAGGAALLVPQATAKLFFGSSEATDYVLPFVLLLGATSAFYIAYGYFRGLLRLRIGSALQVAALAVLPPAIVVALPDEPVNDLIVLMALGTALLSLAAISGPLLRSVLTARRQRVGDASRELWGYGHRRVPGEMAQLGLFVLVPILAAHVGTLTDVAYLSAGQQVLSMVSLAVIPLGLVLLPSLTRMWAEDRERAAGYVGQLSSFAVTVAVFTSLQTAIYADVAVREWLGPEFDGAGSVVRVTVAPAGLFVVYLMLRSTLDAVAVKSYNSRNNLIALAIFGAVAAILLPFELASPAMGVAWAFAAGISAQGALTFATVHRLFGVGWRDYGFPYTLPLSLVAGAAALAMRPTIDDSSAALLLLLLLEFVLAAAYFGAVALSPVLWPRVLAARFFER